MSWWSVLTCIFQSLAVVLLLIVSFLGAVVLLYYFYDSKIAERIIQLIIKFLLYWNKQPYYRQNTIKGINLAEILKFSKRKQGNSEKNHLNQLEVPNNTMRFPLPKYYTHGKQSEQKMTMVVKQVYVILRVAGQKVIDAILNVKPILRFRKMMKILNLNILIKEHEIEDLYMINEVFERNRQSYSLEKEMLFGESFINGQNPYSIKSYTGKTYLYKQSKEVEVDYQDAVKKSFKNEILDQNNLNKVGLTSQHIRELISSGKDLYCSLYEDLESVCKGQIVPTEKTIYLDDGIIRSTVDPEQVGSDGKYAFTAYLQVPYAIFTKVTVKGVSGYICIAIAYREYETGSKKITVYSPFFASQSKLPNVWELARLHAGQVHFNDFSVRVHLGILHFTTSQYNVPFYNFKDRLEKAVKNDPTNKELKKKYQRLDEFYNFTLNTFNTGLEGVNTSAVASLVHPIKEYSLVNNVFVFSPQIALEIIARHSNSVNLNSYNTETLIKNLDLQSLAKDQNNQLHYDRILFEDLKNYIAKVYKAYNIAQFETEIIQEINSFNQNMQVMKYDQKLDAPKPKPVPEQTPRPQIEQGKLLDLFQNLAFCWVVYHSHTFANISLATYFNLHPGMLCQPLRGNKDEWENINEDLYLPNWKVVMESAKLTASTTQRDSENVITDVIAQLKVEAQRIQGEKDDSKQVESAKSAKSVAKAAAEFVDRLDKLQKSITKINEERHEQGKFRFNWLNPEAMQTSLNI